MKNKQLRVPAVKNYELNNIIGNLLYHNEAVKIEKDQVKREFHSKRLMQLKQELEKYKAAN
jgi:hypothetical protein